MRPIILLGQLNEIDLAVDALRARAAQIAEALQEPAALQAARAVAAEAEAEWMRWRAVQRERELVQQSALARLTQAQSRLYGGKVRNPKELTDVEKDVQQLGRQFSQAEDELLDALIALESADELRTRRQAELAQHSAAWENSRAGLLAEQAQTAESLAAERARLAAARRDVPPGPLRTYDALRPRRAGRTVARLDGDTCSVCLVAVSPGRIAAARDSDELTYCENCGRLLWAD